MSHGDGYRIVLEDSCSCGSSSSSSCSCNSSTGSCTGSSTAYVHRTKNPSGADLYPLEYLPYASQEPRLSETVSTFRTTISPLRSLTAIHTGKVGRIGFVTNRQGRQVTFQWEGFHGLLDGSGIPYLTVNATLPEVPPFRMNFPVQLLYAGEIHHAFLEIDPGSDEEQIKFFLSPDRSGSSSKIGDRVEIMGGAASWIAP